MRLNAVNMLSLWPRMVMRVALGSSPRDFMAFWMSRVTPPRSRPVAEAWTSITLWTETWLIMEMPEAGRTRAMAPRYDAPPAGSSPGLELEMSCTLRPSGVPRSEGSESTR